jgi:hypothetical protein
MAELIAEAVRNQDWHLVLNRLGRDKALDAFLIMLPELSAEERGAVARHAWEMPDRVPKNTWREVFQFLDPAELMLDSERKLLEVIPKKLTVFRGFCGARGTELGMSWTDDVGTARFFASYRTIDPRIAIACIQKSRIAAFIVARSDERELIVPDMSAADIVDVTLISPYP